MSNLLSSCPKRGGGAVSARAAAEFDTLLICEHAICYTYFRCSHDPRARCDRVLYTHHKCDAHTGAHVFLLSVCLSTPHTRTNACFSHPSNFLARSKSVSKNTHNNDLACYTIHQKWRSDLLKAGVRRRTRFSRMRCQMQRKEVLAFTCGFCK